MTPAEIVECLAKFPTATVYEAVGKRGAVHQGIRALHKHMRLAGIAYPVKVLPGESLAVLLAIEEAPAGHVLVIDCGELGASTVWGGTSSLAAGLRGLKGCVTNGNARDFDELKQLQFSVFAAGVSVAGTLKNHPGWKNIPVSLGGVIVTPGDYVLGDADGVVVVPAAQGEEAIAASREQHDKETTRDARIRKGESLSVVLDLVRG